MASETTPPPPSGGAVKRAFPDLDEIFRAGWDLFSAQFPALFIFFTFYVVANVISFGPLLMWTVENVEEAGADFDQWSMPSPGAWIALVVGGLLTFFVWMGITQFVLSYTTGEVTSDGAWDRVRSAFADMRPRYFPAMGWSIVLGVAIATALFVFVLFLALIGSVLDNAFGAILVALAVLAAVGCAIWAAVKLAFVDYAVLQGPGQPFSRSVRVSDGRFWHVLGVLLVVGAVSGFATGLANGIASSVNSGFGVLIGAIVNAVVSGFMVIWSHAARALMYRSVIPPSE